MFVAHCALVINWPEHQQPLSMLCQQNVMPAKYAKHNINSERANSLCPSDAAVHEVLDISNSHSNVIYMWKLCSYIFIFSPNFDLSRKKPNMHTINTSEADLIQENNKSFLPKILI